MDTAKKMVKFVLLATAVAATLYIVSNTYGLLTADFTSFPWWTAAVFGAYYFGPALLVEWLILLGIKFLEKKKNIE